MLKSSEIIVIVAFEEVVRPFSHAHFGPAGGGCSCSKGQRASPATCLARPRPCKTQIRQISTASSGGVIHFARKTVNEKISPGNRPSRFTPWTDSRRRPLLYLQLTRLGAGARTAMRLTDGPR